MTASERRDLRRIKDGATPARERLEEAARREPPSFFRGADPVAFALCLAYRGEREIDALKAELVRAARVRTAAFCSYRPGPAASLVWEP